MLGIKADNVVIDVQENSITVDNIIIGVYNGILSKNGQYKALIGLEVLEEIEDVEISV